MGKFVIQDAQDLIAQISVPIIISGPPGSGKTYTALMMGSVLAKARGTWVGVIETERGRSALYSNQFPHKIIVLDDFRAESYMEAMDAFKEAGCGVLVIDSLTHEWDAANGGIRARVDKLAEEKFSRNTWAAWGPAKQVQTRFMTAIMQYPGFVIATARAKVHTEQVTINGRTTVQKLGLDVVQSSDIEYEFVLALQFASNQHDLVVTKSMLGQWMPVGEVMQDPDESLAQRFLDWIAAGAPKFTSIPTAPLRPLPAAIAAERESLREAVFGVFDDVEQGENTTPVPPAPTPAPAVEPATGKMDLKEFNANLRTGFQMSQAQAAKLLGIHPSEFAKPGRDLDADIARIAELVREKEQAAPAPKPASNEPMATEQQLRSIAKLCEALGKPEPEPGLTNAQARDLLSDLSKQYQEMRRAS